MKKKQLYPGVEEVEKIKDSQKKWSENEEPDFIAGKPNYAKWPYLTPEKVLMMLNID